MNFRSSLLLSIVLFSGYNAFASESKSPIRIYVDGVYDLFHAGHISSFYRSIEAASKACGVDPTNIELIVGVMADDEATQYKRKPIWTIDERMLVISACKLVHQAIANAPMPITKDFLQEHQIDYVMHGDDFNPDTIRYWYGPAIDQGKFLTVPYTKGISTSTTIKRILDRSDELTKKKK